MILLPRALCRSRRASPRPPGSAWAGGKDLLLLGPGLQVQVNHLGSSCLKGKDKGEDE